MTKRLLLLNGIAALMIGFHHGAAMTYSAMFDWANRYRAVEVPNYDLVGSFSYYVIFAIRQLDSFAVPAFLFVSGFFVTFLASRDKTQLTLDRVLPRIRTLLIPLVFWTILRLALMGKLRLSFTAMVEDALTTYYYLPLLFQLYLLSPRLVPLARRNWRGLLLLAAMVQFGAEAARYLKALEITLPGLDLLIRVTPQWFFPRHLLYFTLGVVFGVHIPAASQTLTRYRWHLLGIVAAAAVLTFVEERAVATYLGREWMGRTFDTLARLIYATGFSLCFVAFHTTPLPFNRQLADLGTRSLGIYLMNTPVIYVVGSALYHLAPWILAIPLLYFSIQTVLGLGIPLLVMEVARRTPIIRRVQSYAFG